MKTPMRLTRFFLLTLMVLTLTFSQFKARAQNSRLPKVDFSEMEKDYEIVSWVYESKGYLRLVIKPKHDGPHEDKFVFVFFDADGVKFDGPNVIFNNGFMTAAGTVENGEAYAPDEATMKKVKGIVVYQLLGNGSLVGPKPKVEKPTNVPATTPAKADTDKPSNTANGKTAECSFEKQPASNPKTKYSLPLIKSLLYERYSFEKNTGGLSSPADIGVKFLDIKLLGSYRNTVTVVPGRGAQRKNDGAPVDATIYRFHAKYIVCRMFSDSTRRTQYESDNVCFKDKNGGWICAVDSVPQIQDLK